MDSPDCLPILLSRSVFTVWSSCFPTFHHATLCYRGICYGHVTVRVCLSVTSQCSTKMAKYRIIQTILRDSPGNLVF